MDAAATVAPDAMQETYEDIERMIFMMAWKAVEKFGGDWDEYYSLANEAFIDAYNSFNPEKAKFTTWLWHHVTSKILKSRYKSKLEQMTVAGGEDIDLTVHADKNRFDIDRFLFELSDNAKQVVELLLESPWDLSEIACSADGPSCIRSGLIHQLRDMGWTVAAICNTFGEIREALVL